MEKHVRHLRQASMLTRSRERKPREHESHVSSRQVRKEIVYQKGCYQVRARVQGVWAHLRVRNLSAPAGRTQEEMS